MSSFKVGIAQINTSVGDLSGNTTKILSAYRQLVAAGADVVLTPELSLCGYLPKDLLFREGFVKACGRQLKALAKEVGEVPLIVGTVEASKKEYGLQTTNCAVVLRDGNRVATAQKSLIPMYDVTDERRYFEPAEEVTIVEIAGKRVALAITEDLFPKQYVSLDFFGDRPLEAYGRHGAEVILCLGASIFAVGKPAKRLEILGGIWEASHLPVVIANLVGGDGHVLFDGGSVACNAQGDLLTVLPRFVEHCEVVDPWEGSKSVPELATDIEDIHSALVMGVREFIEKSGFRQVLLGLGGGIDSAVVAALAVEALGAENVLGVTMPGPFSSEGSVKDSVALAKNLGIECKNIPITKTYEALLAQMAGEFAGKAFDSTEENLQSRLRGVTLMALSNKTGRMVLSTGNKSELAVGYCTLYGDMAGGLAPIADLTKTRVYELARYINREREIIPQASIDKAPSAELRPDQKDQDSLPPYEVLDEIIRLYVEESHSAESIEERGFDREIVRWVAAKIESNEYKRQQAAPGLKVTMKAFGTGRRMPLNHKFCDCEGTCG